MKPEHITGLRYRHKDYYTDSVDELPNGWLTIIDSFLLQLEDVGDLNPSVSVRFERGLDGLRAFCFPEMQVWTPGQYASLRAAQLRLYAGSQATCVICGEPGQMVQAATAKGSSDDILCQEHTDDALDTIRQRQFFASSLAAINPPHGGWPLDYPKNLWSVIQRALEEMERVAVEYKIEGLVTVTRCRVDDGTLFFRVKFDAALPLGAQQEISDLARGAECEADMIWQRGSDND